MCGYERQSMTVIRIWIPHTTFLHLIQCLSVLQIVCLCYVIIGLFSDDFIKLSHRPWSGLWVLRVLSWWDEKPLKSECLTNTEDLVLCSSGGVTDAISPPLNVPRVMLKTRISSGSDWFVGRLHLAAQRNTKEQDNNQDSSAFLFPGSIKKSCFRN